MTILFAVCSVYSIFFCVTEENQTSGKVRKIINILREVVFRFCLRGSYEMLDSYLKGSTSFEKERESNDNTYFVTHHYTNLDYINNLNFTF